MRKSLNPQLPIVHPSIKHDHAAELKKISEILDGEPEILDLVLADLLDGGVMDEDGREGMTAEQVVRSLIVKQMNGFSYDELAFHVADSRSYGSFCRFGFDDKTPSKSTLQRNIKQLKPETLENINRLLVNRAVREKIEQGRKIRTDCTVVETDIHEPSDSSLLWDCVRVLVRLMKQARAFAESRFTDHKRRAKRRAMAIDNAKKEPERVKLYNDLIMVTRRTVEYAEKVSVKVRKDGGSDLTEIALAIHLANQLDHFISLARRVITQTERRVLHGEQVPAEDKVLSIFEPHTDIIIKDRRDTLFGHKVALSAGASGMVVDGVVEKGNPADSTLAVPMVKRQKDLFGRVPRQIAFDGGFTSKANLAKIKDLGVQDVAFHKKRSLEVTDMVKSTWVFRQLRKFRAGIEGIISFLKRCFGLDRCRWSGFQSFKAYVWSSIISANLLVMARHMLS